MHFSGRPTWPPTRRRREPRPGYSVKQPTARAARAMQVEAARAPRRRAEHSLAPPAPPGSSRPRHPGSSRPPWPSSVCASSRSRTSPACVPPSTRGLEFAARRARTRRAPVGRHPPLRIRSRFVIETPTLAPLPKQLHRISFYWTLPAATSPDHQRPWHTSFLFLKRAPAPRRWRRTHLKQQKWPRRAPRPRRIARPAFLFELAPARPRRGAPV
mmetsp:Transcript_10251/g.30087  ORF Transcript_10251/g.30087 Transcript_10251/m.30087 type:complete len:214 (+) Transcript_10251:4653-5294(+)